MPIVMNEMRTVKTKDERKKIFEQFKKSVVAPPSEIFAYEIVNTHYAFVGVTLIDDKDRNEDKHAVIYDIIFGEEIEDYWLVQDHMWNVFIEIVERCTDQVEKAVDSVDLDKDVIDKYLKPYVSAYNDMAFADREFTQTYTLNKQKTEPQAYDTAVDIIAYMEEFTSGNDLLDVTHDIIEAHSLIVPVDYRIDRKSPFALLATAFRVKRHLNELLAISDNSSDDVDNYSQDISIINKTIGKFWSYWREAFTVYCDEEIGYRTDVPLSFTTTVEQLTSLNDRVKDIVTKKSEIWKMGVNTMRAEQLLESDIRESIVDHDPILFEIERVKHSYVYNDGPELHTETARVSKIKADAFTGVSKRLNDFLDKKKFNVKSQMSADDQQEFEQLVADMARLKSLAYIESFEQLKTVDDTDTVEKLVQLEIDVKNNLDQKAEVLPKLIKIVQDMKLVDTEINKLQNQPNFRSDFNMAIQLIDQTRMKTPTEELGDFAVKTYKDIAVRLERFLRPDIPATFAEMTPDDQKDFTYISNVLHKLETTTLVETFDATAHGAVLPSTYVNDDVGDGDYLATGDEWTIGARVVLTPDEARQNAELNEIQERNAAVGPARVSRPVHFDLDDRERSREVDLEAIRERSTKERVTGESTHEGGKRKTSRSVYKGDSVVSNENTRQEQVQAEQQMADMFGGSAVGMFASTALLAATFLMGVLPR